MTRRMTRTCAVLATTLLATTATSLSGVANAESQDTVSVRLLAFNDLHAVSARRKVFAARSGRPTARSLPQVARRISRPT